MDKYRIEIPEFFLVAMIGGTSSGKSSFALKYFKPTEVLSSDFFRGMVCDDENSQSVSGDAFDLLYYAANKRLNNMKLWHCVSKGRNATEAGKKECRSLYKQCP